MIEYCNDCEYKNVGTKSGGCKKCKVSLHEPPSPCEYGMDEEEKLRIKEIIEEKKHRYKKGEKVYHKSLKKYALYEETDPSNYDKAYVLLLNDNGTSERKRVTIDLLKRENEV